MQCMRMRVPLHGTSDEQPGIDQCRSIVKELTTLKTKPNAQDGSTPAETESASTLLSEGAAVDKDNMEKAGEFNAMTVALAGEEVDDARVKADALAEVALTKLNVYRDVGDLTSGLSSSVLPGAKVMIHVDAQTSKLAVISKLIDKAAKTLPRRSYLIIWSWLGFSPPSFLRLRTLPGSTRASSGPGTPAN